MTGYIDGKVVVQRQWHAGGKKKGRRPLYAWTLHRDDCAYLRRTTQALPAPIEPYANTIPCSACRPDGGAHRITYIEMAADRFTASCDTCSATADAPSAEAARMRMRRQHESGQN